MLKPFSGEKPRRNGAQKWRCLGKMGVETLDFGFETPKRHFLARNRVVWRILRHNRCTRLGCSLSQEPKKNSRVTLGAPNHACTEPKPQNRFGQKFCMVVDIPDAVTYTNFGDHQLRGFWVAGGQISLSPSDFHRRPYNTLALPCERVISCIYYFASSSLSLSVRPAAASASSMSVFPAFSRCHFLHSTTANQNTVFVTWTTLTIRD